MKGLKTRTRLSALRIRYGLLLELLVLEVLDPELLLPGVVAAPWLVLDQVELPDELVMALLLRPLLLPVL